LFHSVQTSGVSYVLAAPILLDLLSNDQTHRSLE
jgi:hypothetical protein